MVSAPCKAHHNHEVSSFGVLLGRGRVVANARSAALMHEIVWFIEQLPDFIVMVVFSGSWKIQISPLRPDTPIEASCNPLRILPPLLPTISPYYDASRVFAYYRLNSFRITKPPNGTVTSNSSTQQTAIK